MKSAEFSKEFAAGKLGDDAECFDWLFVYEAYNKRIKQKRCAGTADKPAVLVRGQVEGHDLGLPG